MSKNFCLGPLILKAFKKEKFIRPIGLSNLLSAYSIFTTLTSLDHGRMSVYKHFLVDHNGGKVNLSHVAHRAFVAFIRISLFL